MLSQIEAAPKPKWRVLSKRRLQTWPSDLNKDVLLDAPLPNWLTEPIISRIVSYSTSLAQKDSHIFMESPHGGPNHVLINEYLPRQGLFPHTDGPAYYPVVCTVSLGSSLCLDIHAAKDDGGTESEPRWKILQEPRSLLITTDELYKDYLHGIAENVAYDNLSPSTVSNWDLLRSSDEIVDGRIQRKLRTSLTYRDVLKVSKLGGKFAMFRKH